MASQPHDDPRSGGSAVGAPRRRWWFLGLDAHLAGRTAAFVSSNVVATAVGAVAALLLSRELSVAAFGSYSFATSFIDYAALFFEFGLFLPAARLAANAPLERQRSVTGAAITAFLPIAAAFSLFLFASSFFVDELFSVTISRALLVSLPVAFAYPMKYALQQLCQGRDEMNVYSASSAIGRLAFLASIVVFVGTGQTLSVTTALLLTSTMLAAGWIPVVVRLRPTFRRLPVALSELVDGARAYGTQAYVGRILSIGTYNIDVLMIAAFSNADQVALYAVAGGLTAPISLPGYGLAAALFPAMARSEHIPRWALGFSVVTTGILLVALLAIARPLVDALLPDQYLDGLYLLIPLGIIQLIRSVTSVYNTFLSAHGRGRELRHAATAMTLSNLIFNASLIPTYAAAGAAWASVFALLVNLFVHVKQYRGLNTAYGRRLPMHDGDRRSRSYELARASELTRWVYHALRPERQQESHKPREILRSGYAWCAGYATVLQALLTREGMTARVVTLLLQDHPVEGMRDTHTLVELKTGGRWNALDPTCNVVFHHSIDELVQDPSRADQAASERPKDDRYRKRGYDLFCTSFAYERVGARFDHVSTAPLARFSRLLRRVLRRPIPEWSRFVRYRGHE